MANALRGEVDYVVVSDDGHERRYTLRLSTNAICEMQTRMSKTYGQIVSSLSSVDMNALRELLFMALQKHHKADFPSIDDVGDLIDDGGGPASIVDCMTELFLLNQPKDDGQQASTGKRGRATGPRPAVKAS